MADRVLMTARWVIGHERSFTSLQREMIPAMRDRAQAQFDRLVAQYPDRTFGHPLICELFPSSYRRIAMSR